MAGEHVQLGHGKVHHVGFGVVWIKVCTDSSRFLKLKSTGISKIITHLKLFYHKARFQVEKKLKYKNTWNIQIQRELWGKNYYLPYFKRYDHRNKIIKLK